MKDTAATKAEMKVDVKPAPVAKAEETHPAVVEKKAPSTLYEVIEIETHVGGFIRRGRSLGLYETKEQAQASVRDIKASGQANRVHIHAVSFEG